MGATLILLNPLDLNAKIIAILEFQSSNLDRLFQQINPKLIIYHPKSLQPKSIHHEATTLSKLWGLNASELLKLLLYQ